MIHQERPHSPELQCVLHCLTSWLFNRGHAQACGADLTYADDWSANGSYTQFLPTPELALTGRTQGQTFQQRWYGAGGIAVIRGG